MSGVFGRRRGGSTVLQQSQVNNMTAFITVEKSFSPLARCWGYSVRHDATSDMAWGFSIDGAINTLMNRLVLKGYDRSFH